MMTALFARPERLPRLFALSILLLAIGLVGAPA